jgi:FtsZ-binding cell division protein ZapB
MLRRYIVIPKPFNPLLESQYNQAIMELNNANDTISTLQANTLALQSSNNALTSEVASLSASVATLQGDKATLQASVTDLQNQVSSLNGQLATANNTVNLLQNPFGGHWWNGITGTNEKHWYITSNTPTITGTHTSKNLFSTVYTSEILNGTIAQNNPFSASGVLHVTSHTGFGNSSFTITLNATSTILTYNGGQYTKQ